MGGSVAIRVEYRTIGLNIPVAGAHTKDGGESVRSGLVLKYQARDVWYKCYERGPRVAVLIQYTPVLVVYKGDV